MRIAVRCTLGLALIGFGYLVGSWGGRLETAHAQDPAGQPAGQPAATPLKKETLDKLKTASDALRSAMRALEEDGRYVPAVEGLNSFAVTVGGVDAIRDLESDGAVDPETFAMLYADKATDDVDPHLGRDKQGRLTYKNKLVRIYSVARLRQLLAERELISTAN